MTIVLLFLGLTVPPDDASPNARVRTIESLRATPDRSMVEQILPMLGDPHPKVHLRAIRALKGTTDPAGVDLLIRRGLRHSNSRVRRGACEALGGIDDLRAFEPLCTRLRDTDSHVRSAAAGALATLDADRARGILISAFRRDRRWPLRTTVLDGLKPAGLLEAAARDRQYQVRLAAAEANPTEALMGDRDWRVRAAAIDACTKTRSRDGIGWLIQRLSMEKGRLRWDAWSALRDLAGRDLGPTAEPWRAWWKVNRDRFRVPPAGGADVSTGVATQASFFSIPILSTRIIFVLDLSGSMRDPAPEGRKSKLDVAKEGMIATIRSLPRGVRFGITGLGCGADGNDTERARKTWRGLRLLPATPGARADAERFVRGLSAKGFTDLYDGVAHAFENPDVDTIFLYTDGGASKGTFVAAGEILSQLERMNRFRRIVIHTVEVPGVRNAPDHRRLLADLAARTGGLCRLYEP